MLWWLNEGTAFLVPQHFEDEKKKKNNNNNNKSKIIRWRSEGGGWLVEREWKPSSSQQQLGASLHGLTTPQSSIFSAMAAIKAWNLSFSWGFFKTLETRPTCTTTTIVILESCALNAESQHLMLRFNKNFLTLWIPLRFPSFYPLGIGGESRPKDTVKRGWLSG
jgi:hypothetical protein